MTRLDDPTCVQYSAVLGWLTAVSRLVVPKTVLVVPSAFTHWPPCLSHIKQAGDTVTVPPCPAIRFDPIDIDDMTAVKLASRHGGLNWVEFSTRSVVPLWRATLHRAPAHSVLACVQLRRRDHNLRHRMWASLHSSTTHNLKLKLKRLHGTELDPESSRERDLRLALDTASTLDETASSKASPGCRVPASSCRAPSLQDSDASSAHCIYRQHGSPGEMPVWHNNVYAMSCFDSAEPGVSCMRMCDPVQHASSTVAGTRCWNPPDPPRATACVTHAVDRDCSICFSLVRRRAWPCGAILQLVLSFHGSR